MIGAWNSGQLGYFIDNEPVVNLDGLVQDSRYLNEVLRTGKWREYFRKRNIRYLVDYNSPDSAQTFGPHWDRTSFFRDLIPMSQVYVIRMFGPAGDRYQILVLDIGFWIGESEKDGVVLPDSSGTNNEF
jgi:hypothetical protein